jgi:DNA processing protein
MEMPLFDMSELNLSDCEQSILRVLGKEPSHIEQIIAAADLPAAQIHSAVITLQLKGLVKQLPGSVFVRKGI